MTTVVRTTSYGGVVKVKFCLGEFFDDPVYLQLVAVIQTEKEAYNLLCDKLESRPILGGPECVDLLLRQNPPVLIDAAVADDRGAAVWAITRESSQQSGFQGMVTLALLQSSSRWRLLGEGMGENEGDYFVIGRLGMRKIDKLQAGIFPTELEKFGRPGDGFRAGRVRFLRSRSVGGAKAAVGGGKGSANKPQPGESSNQTGVGKHTTDGAEKDMDSDGTERGGRVMHADVHRLIMDTWMNPLGSLAAAAPTP
jgi:hypothetical protein